MSHGCNNTSAGQIIRRDGKIAVIERMYYPESFALPAGHVDDGEDFATAAIRETAEEVGITIDENRLVFTEDIDNPCKRGPRHMWRVYDAVRHHGALKAESDAKEARFVTLDELQNMARRTEYFMKKYNIPYDRVGELTIAIFGKNAADKATDPEWSADIGLEPVWYYMLKKLNVIQ